MTVVWARLWGSPLLTSLTVNAESVRQSTSIMARSRSPSLFTTLLYRGDGLGNHR